jgi:hypothetical protein
MVPKYWLVIAGVVTVMSLRTVLTTVTTDCSPPCHCVTYDTHVSTHLPQLYAIAVTIVIRHIAIIPPLPSLPRPYYCSYLQVITVTPVIPCHHCPTITTVAFTVTSGLPTISTVSTITAHHVHRSPVVTLSPR